METFIICAQTHDTLATLLSLLLSFACGALCSSHPFVVVHSGRGKRAYPGLGGTVPEVGQNDSAAQMEGECGALYSPPEPSPNSWDQQHSPPGPGASVSLTSSKHWIRRPSRPDQTICVNDTMSRRGNAPRQRGGFRIQCQSPACAFVLSSAHLWEDDDGRVHTIPQGEGGEQGDALMPFLFCVGQHAALEAIHRGLNPNEKLLAFLDDVTESWLAHCTILPRKSCGPTAGSESMGSEVPTSKGSRFWVHQCGHDDYVRRLLEKVQAKQQVLLDAIPKVPDVQSAWLLLLHCASACANYQLRVVRPGLVESFAESHDQGLWRSLCDFGGSCDTCDVVTRAAATLPLSLDGFGLRSVERTKVAACWASWADVLPMIQARHPAVAAFINTWKGNHGHQA